MGDHTEIANSDRTSAVIVGGDARAASVYDAVRHIDARRWTSHADTGCNSRQRRLSTVATANANTRGDGNGRHQGNSQLIHTGTP